MLNEVIQLPEYQFLPSDKDEWLRETKTLQIRCGNEKQAGLTRTISYGETQSNLFCSEMGWVVWSVPSHHTN